MDLEAQSPKARREHARLGSGAKTCVDCHEEAGHAALAPATAEQEQSFDF